MSTGHRVIVWEERRLISTAMVVLVEGFPETAWVRPATAPSDVLRLAYDGADLMVLGVDPERPDAAMEVLRAIRAGRRQLRVLLVTDDDDLGVILRGLKLGADGACLSRTGPETLRLAIGNVIAGEVALPGDRVTEILHGLLEGNAEAQIETTSVLSLTDREHQVLRMLADGQGPAEIAVGLGLSISTVRTHLQHVMGKLGVHNQLHAAAKGRQLLGPSSPR